MSTKTKSNGKPAAKPKPAPAAEQPRRQPECANDLRGDLLRYAIEAYDAGRAMWVDIKTRSRRAAVDWRIEERGNLLAQVNFKAIEEQALMLFLMAERGLVLALQANRDDADPSMMLAPDEGDFEALTTSVVYRGRLYAVCPDMREISYDGKTPDFVITVTDHHEPTFDIDRRLY